MLKKGLYIIVSVWFICLMSSFGVSYPLQKKEADVQISSPFDSHPPQKTAVLRAKPSPKELAEDAARQARKSKHRAKCTIDNSRFVDVVPISGSFYLSGLPRIASLIKQHFRTVLTGALPHYYAYLFRLTPF